MAPEDIKEKIERAKKRFASCDRILLSDSKLLELLSSFKEARALSHAEMERAGITDICRRCETEAGGSCCGAGIEERYDQWILIANLLLGVTLPEARWKADSCYFLGPTGCTLAARHAICVNYLCKNITDQVNPQRITQMREKEGEELEVLFFVCERIKEIIKDCGHQHQKGP